MDKKGTGYYAYSVVVVSLPYRIAKRGCKTGPALGGLPCDSKEIKSDGQIVSLICLKGMLVLVRV